MLNAPSFSPGSLICKLWPLMISLFNEVTLIFTLSRLSRLFYEFSEKIFRKGVVVVPYWPSQPWFPLFIKLTVSEVLIFDPNIRLLSSPIRKALILQGTPESAIETTMASLASSSFKQYERPIFLWRKFCKNTKISIFSAPRTHFLEFLAECFQTLWYSYHNTYRSAISLISAVNISQDALIKRFMKGASVQKPPEPRYSETWDPTKVLDFLSTLFPNSTPSFDKLSKKLVLLLALITAQRSQALSLIKLDYINFFKEEVRIKISDRHRTSGLRQQQPLLILPSFPEKSSICLVDALREYLTKSKALRLSNDPFLFIVTKAPYNHISSRH